MDFSYLVDLEISNLQKKKGAMLTDEIGELVVEFKISHIQEHSWGHSKGTYALGGGEGTTKSVRGEEEFGWKCTYAVTVLNNRTKIQPRFG